MFEEGIERVGVLDFYEGSGSGFRHFWNEEGENHKGNIRRGDGGGGLQLGSGAAVGLGFRAFWILCLVGVGGDWIRWLLAVK